MEPDLTNTEPVSSHVYLASARRASICFHFVDNPDNFLDTIAGSKRPFPTGAGHERTRCSIVTSMEFDLVAFKFQDEDLVQTNVIYRRADESPPPEDVTHRCRVDVILPGAISYISEGREQALVTRNGTYCTYLNPPFPSVGEEVIPCEVQLSRTYFKRSGIVVWNVVLQRTGGGAFNEFDLIKLTHLYEGKSEGTELAERAKFVVYADDDTPSGRVSLDGLLEAIWGELAGAYFRKLYPAPYAGRSSWLARRPRKGRPVRSSPVAGESPPEALRKRPAGATIQLAMGADFGGETVEEVLRVVYGARNEGTPGNPLQGGDGEPDCLAKLEVWLDEGETTLVGGSLKAFAGVTNAIFDYERVDEEEVIDTLEPTFHSGDSFIKVHRRSLVNICDSDRALDAVGDWFGTSPYLVLPHCVVLHNEELIDGVKRSLDGYEDSQDVGELERLQEVCRKAMRTLYLPNIFNYVTEKTIVEEAYELRGSAQMRQENLDRMRELERSLDEAYEGRRNRHGVVVQVLLLILAVAQVFALFTPPEQIQRLDLSEAVLGGAMAFLIGAIFIILGLQSRKRRTG